MARRAAHTLVNVNAVVEIDEVGQAVDFHPLNRLICAETLANWFEIRRIGIQHGMAIHAGFRRRDTRNGGSLDRGMTVPAVEPIVAHVVLVAELHRLLARNVLVRRIGRTRQPQNAHEPQSDQKNSREQTESGDKICAAMKNLGHVSVALLRRLPRKEQMPGSFAVSWPGSAHPARN